MKLSQYPDLKSKPGKIHLMTHLVAGYPSIDINKKLIPIMAKCGVKLIEIQIPFSDPIADGPIIMKANQHSLQNGTNLATCFKLMEEMSREVDIPLLFMTYGNIPFAYGMSKFICQSLETGCSGFIVPDLPYDEDTFEFTKLCEEKDLPNIAVVSPDTSTTRLNDINQFAKGFIYTTLKMGITGPIDKMAAEGITHTQSLRQKMNLPIAAGFGISKPEHVHSLIDIADIAVIGSKLIELIETQGVKGVADFLDACLKPPNKK